MTQADVAPVPTVERFAPLVRRIARGMLRNPHDAEDAIQETLCRVVAHADQFDGRGSLEGWVRRIAVRTSLRLLRWRRLVGLFVEDVPVPAATGPDADTLRRLYDALDRLSARERAAFVLRYQEELSFADAAAAMNVRETTARGYAFRAVEKLRRLMEDAR